ncbi:28S ribosomal protein S10, mitochondrial [Athalia rosae]|uniref:28S ribosomal protein S10, mitochondrial n=1 Tax=Athalia rosae TaxID=37344 RepID=UPI002033D362|nr:28S ribosomal protein S10, mitochondrial [Athalia rosae]
MFNSKAVSIFRNLIGKAQCETISKIRNCTLSTEVQQPTETVLPDKLYKEIELEVRGNDTAVLRSYAQFTTMAANHLGIKIGKNWGPRKAKHERLTLLKSVQIYKKHRVQYETRTYYRFIHFHHLTGSTADTVLEYLQRNLPEGVAMKVTKIEILPIPDAFRTPPSSITAA